MNNSIQIYDYNTGETIVREMTDAEQVQRNAEAAAYLAKKQAEQAEQEAKAAQRQALLSRLGITEEEARILLGGN